MAKANKVKVTLVKSTISCTAAQKGTVAALGLKKIGQSNTFVDSATLQGQLKVVSHLVKVENV
ncbi:MAG: 50S ribosomal protein L30 [Clostridia bacterium]|nr:50S ribosomal protein L30 [Clostridia bacterium]MBQ4098252.1 50S ribosomal protein L30 [Clostridia bacterium]